LSRTGWAFVGALVALAVAFAYDVAVVADGPMLVWVLTWDGAQLYVLRLDPGGVGWLAGLSLVLFAFTVVVPLATNRRRTVHYWHQLRRRPLAILSLGYLVAATLVGFLGPVVFGEPTIRTQWSYQPPLFTSVEIGYPLTRCAGRVVDGACHGSLWFPTGTDQLGREMWARVVVALRVSMTVALVTSMLIVPLATAVGTAAGYLGGRVDAVLMRYVDVQQTIPAIVVYLVLVVVAGRSLFLIVLVFGLLSWGGVARVVRSEVLQRREARHVLAARGQGASHWWVIRKHVLPNTSNTVFTALSLQVPVLILAEAALAYLRLGERYSDSFGQLVALGMRSHVPGYNFPNAWWIAVIPAAFLALTVLSFNVLGDALRDVLDPHSEP
jgi:peptide/nickel transport system permease protein